LAAVNGSIAARTWVSITKAILNLRTSCLVSAERSPVARYSLGATYC
jgi:hypothetical protein